MFSGTSVPSPLRTLQALWRAMPCYQRALGEAAGKPRRCCLCLPARGNVRGDDCCGLATMEQALRRRLEDAAQAEGSAPPELVYATWDTLSGGRGHAPAFAVLADWARKELVVPVRGTFSIRDCISDAASSPVTFDPDATVSSPDTRGLWQARAKPDAQSFDDKYGTFVHAGIWTCASDVKQLLDQDVNLPALLEPGGRFAGFRVVCVGHSLGAGVASVLALLLRAERLLAGGKADDVRFVGVEPPGGTMSQKLRDLTVRLGWISGVCSHDWVPRVSIRSLQQLRNHVYNELLQCERSKLAITVLTLAHFCNIWCIGRPLGALLRCLAGGRIDFREDSFVADGVDANAVKALREDSGQPFPLMLPPGRLLYVRPLDTEGIICGCFLRHGRWAPLWVQPEQLGELILSYRSVELHFPNILRPAFLAAQKELETTRNQEPKVNSSRSFYGTFFGRAS